MLATGSNLVVGTLGCNGLTGELQIESPLMALARNYNQIKTICGTVSLLSSRLSSRGNYSSTQNLSSEETTAAPTNFLSDYGSSEVVLESGGYQHWFKNWQELRRHKLTASTFGGAIGFWHGRRVQLWLEKIGAIEPFTANLATRWSNFHEEEALDRYNELTENMALFEFPEFQVHPKDDWLAASADGLVYNLPYRGVLEIKCPFFDGDMSKPEASPWKRLPRHCIPQAQGLMEIMDRDWMHFYVWTPNGTSLFRLYRDRKYWDLMKIALHDFWWEHVQPAREVCSQSVITDPLVELKWLKPTSRHGLCSDIVYASKHIVEESELLMRETNGIKRVYC